MKEIEVEKEINGEKIKQKEEHKTKIQIAKEMVEEIVKKGFKIKIVLADSEYGEATEFRRLLEKLKLKFVLATRSNHAVWMPKDQYIRYNKWKEFNREFSNGDKELRYIREIVYGKRNPNHTNRYYILTTDKETLPQESTYYIMTNLEGKIEKTVGNIYGLRTWIEYGLKQSKNQLGWADFRFTDYLNIERWWELVFCAYLLVSLQSSCFRLNPTNPTNPTNPINSINSIDTFRKHPRWDHSKGWNNLLNNLRLIIQPYIFFYLINPWLSIFPIPSFSDNFATLISFMNQFSHLFPIWHKRDKDDYELAISDNGDYELAIFGDIDYKLATSADVDYKPIISGYPKKYNLTFDEYLEIVAHYAVLLQQTRQLDKSIEILKQVIAVAPDKANFYLYLADSFWLSDNKTEAINLYNNYISKAKSDFSNNKIAKRALSRTNTSN